MQKIKETLKKIRLTYSLIDATKLNSISLLIMKTKANEVFKKEKIRDNDTTITMNVLPNTFQVICRLTLKVCQ
jgi:hypothetical protein